MHLQQPPPIIISMQRTGTIAKPIISRMSRVNARKLMTPNNHVRDIIMEKARAAVDDINDMLRKKSS